MRMKSASIVAVALGFGLSVLAVPAPAQIGSLKRRAEQEARKRAEAAAVKAAADSVKSASADSDAKARSTAPAAPAAATDAAPTAVSPTAQAPTRGDAKVWENYDFVPGSKVLFYTDFSEDRVGNFARGLRYVGGAIEVVDRGGVKVLRSTARSTMLIPVGRKLPQRFTLEIDMLPSGTRNNDQLVIEGGRSLTRGDGSAEITWTPKGTVIIGSGQDARSAVHIPESVQSQLVGNVVHVRVLMDGGYFKMYTNERRMYNNPDLQFVRDTVIRVMIQGSEEEPTYVTSIRLAESETDVMYDALSAGSRWATHGILFVSGKADLQPESRSVLKEIAATLKQHGDLNVLIEGHTDNVGAAASNLSLSDARAAAVKAALVSEYGIDGARLTTKGLGDTKPSVPNTTVAGRAQNRRVELVKQ
jgi:outer membrane protein OmpA-like peptidoglycan-associated protein